MRSVGTFGPNGANDNVPWWKASTFYQIYPASFQDSNGDGWGDLPGIISRLDYLSDLGVDVLWISPIFDSPQKDMGYDVRDYQKIYEPYGSIEDVDALIKESHARGLKVILDLVINHTSDQHDWFKESRSSKHSAKRDWYIWKPARYDAQGNRRPPTNWRGYFATSTWTWDEHTQEYYLHLYGSDQPDLNWENRECREAIYENTMRFWLDRGVDGFRIDTVNKYSKRQDFVDASIVDPAASTQPAPEMWCNGPRIHEFIHEMNRKVLAPYNAVSVGELSNTPDPAGVIPYVSAAAKELDMVFEFSIIRLGSGGVASGSKYIYQPFPLSQLKKLTAKWQSFIDNTDAWTTVFIENHDNGRAVDRFGETSTREMWARSAKVIALWQTTLSGTLFLYQGQEIGMTNMPKSWGPEEYKDVEAVNFLAEAERTGDPDIVRKTMEGLQILARDHARLPFQWDATPNGGFTTPRAKPWMRVHDNHDWLNAKQQGGDPESVLSFYKTLLRLRKEHKDVFVFGTFELLDPENDSVFAYMKQSSEPVSMSRNAGTTRTALVMLNMSNGQQPYPDPAALLGGGSAKLLVGSLPVPKRETMANTEARCLQPWEARVYVNY